MDRSRKATTFLVSILLLLSALPLNKLEASPGRYRFFIDVNRFGEAEIRIEYSNSYPGRSWVLVPIHGKWSLEVHVGKVVSELKSLGPDSFYSNLTLSFNTTVKLSIIYHFKYASLVSRSDALFISPLIGYPSYDRGVVEVKIREFDGRSPYFEGGIVIGDFGKLMIVTPYIRFLHDGALLRFSQPTDFYGNMINVYRIVIRYKLDPFRNSDVSGIAIRIRTVPVNDSKVTVTFMTPKVYLEEADSLLNIVERGVKELASLTSYIPDAISGEFWLPRRLTYGNELTTLGMVETYIPKRFSISLLTLRMKEEEKIHVILHELSHIFLLGIGISAKIRWVHEGLAEYISLNLGIKINYTEFNKIIRKYLKMTNNMSLTQLKVSLFDYPRFFRIFYDICEERGGLAFLAKVLRRIKDKGGVDNVEELALIFSEITGEDLSSIFNKLKIIS